MRTQVTPFLPQMNNCESQVYTTATPPLERLSSHENLGFKFSICTVLQNPIGFESNKAFARNALIMSE